VAVTHDDVRNIAGLARLAVPDDRLDALVAELNGILAHMDALEGANTAAAPDEADTVRGMRTDADAGPSVPLMRPPSTFAPEWRDGFFLVPRLATHGDAGNVAEEAE
jgi:aspartyl-tRNA(Asn)/glutamyl-tRNA(Gln) amidotransferase subunit C